jgi:hypothetical protein
MAKFVDPIDPRMPTDDDRLRLVRVGEEPNLLNLFTTEVAEVKAHFCKDVPELTGPITCPGVDCPLCFLQNAPRVVQLLPVWNIASESVEVLLIGPQVGPGQLHTELRRAYQMRPADQVLFAVSRQRFIFRVEVKACATALDDARSAFERLLRSAPPLRKALPALSAKQLAAIDSIRRRLKSVGGYPPWTEETPPTAGGERLDD